MNTAIAITAIIAAVVVINIIVTAVRDSTQAKHKEAAPTVARCTVEQCAFAATLADPGGDWTRDSRGRHFCPSHPATTSCWICGQDKGSNEAICRACASSSERP